MHIVRQRLAQPSSPSTVNNKLKIYENYADRISIQYPSNWQIARAILKDDSGTQFSSTTEFIYPLNNLFRFPPSVTITVEKLPQGMTLNQYMKRIDNVTSITYKTTPSISNVHPTFIQGTNATERIIGIQSSSFGLNLKVMQIFALEDGNVYTITYAAQAPDYEKYIDTAQTMIDSFRILTQTNTF